MRQMHFTITIAVLALCAFSGGTRDAVHADGESTHEHHMHGEHVQHLHPAKAPDVVVDLETQPADLRAGSPATIIFSVRDAEGRPEQNLTITHDRLLHVIIAGQDFTVFGHVHPDDSGPITPEMKRAAAFPVRFTFPKAGRYLMAVDSAVDDTPFSEHFVVEVAGGPRMGRYQEDLSRKKVFSGYEVTLSSLPERIVAGKEAMLSYHIKRGGEAVTDLEPYLSALMHLAVIRADLNNFIHTHGELPGTGGGHPMTGHRHMHMTVPEKFGPVIDARVIFPAKGLYQIFGEIKHQGRVIVTSFMVEVQ